MIRRHKPIRKILSVLVLLGLTLGVGYTQGWAEEEQPVSTPVEEPISGDVNDLVTNPASNGQDSVDSEKIDISSLMDNLVDYDWKQDHLVLKLPASWGIEKRVNNLIDGFYSLRISSFPLDDKGTSVVIPDSGGIVIYEWFEGSDIGNKSLLSYVHENYDNPYFSQTWTTQTIGDLATVVIDDDTEKIYFFQSGQNVYAIAYEFRGQKYEEIGLELLKNIQVSSSETIQYKKKNQSRFSKPIETQPLFVSSDSIGGMALPMASVSDLNPKLPWIASETGLEDPATHKVIGKYNGGPHAAGYGNTCSDVSVWSGQNGLDFSMFDNGRVLAVAGGVVESVVSSVSGFGNYVVIRHDNGIRSLYAHNNSINVQVGQAVSQGQVIAYAGCTGNCQGTHIHFQFMNADNSIVSANGLMIDGYKFAVYERLSDSLGWNYQGTAYKGTEYPENFNYSRCNSGTSNNARRWKGTIENANTDVNSLLWSTNTLAGSGGCVPPTSGEWQIHGNCIVTNNSRVLGSVMVYSDGQLEIQPEVIVDMDLRNYRLYIQNGGVVRIRNGGAIN